MHLASLSHREIGPQLFRMEFERGEGEITLNVALEVSDTGLLPEDVEQDLGGWNMKSPGKRLAMSTALSLRSVLRGYRRTLTIRPWIRTFRPHGRAFVLDRSGAAGTSKSGSYVQRQPLR